MKRRDRAALAFAQVYMVALILLTTTGTILTGLCHDEIASCIFAVLGAFLLGWFELICRASPARTKLVCGGIVKIIFAVLVIFSVYSFV